MITQEEWKAKKKKGCKWFYAVILCHGENSIWHVAVVARKLVENYRYKGGPSSEPALVCTFGCRGFREVLWAEYCFFSKKEAEEFARKTNDD